MNEKILIDDLPEHQRKALMDGEGVTHGGHVLGRADVETKADREARLAEEKSRAEEAARYVEDGLASALAEGRLVTSEDREAMKAEVRDELLADEGFLAAVKGGAGTPEERAAIRKEVQRELLADEGFLAAVGKLLEKREKASASSASGDVAAPKVETVEDLLRRTKDELVAMAHGEGVAHETDANKQAIAEAIVRARAETAARGS